MKINSVPCTLNFSETQNNSNLMKVKIVVMHEGENRNGSAFSMQSIESARESLKNVPILGYILRSDDGEALDFDEHNMSVRLVEGKDGYELKEFYEEQIIGVIPETNDYHYEMIDGVNHVCCTGYIFKSYSNGGAELIEDCDSKGVSMEISVEEGNFVDKVYHINKYQYQAVTILGDHVPQGMNGTCNIKKFSFDSNAKQTIENINEEIQKINHGKEDFTMENNTVEFEENKKVDDTEVEAVVQEPEEIPATEVEEEDDAKTEVVDVEETAEEVEVAEEVDTEAEESDDFACGAKKKKKYEDEDDFACGTKKKKKYEDEEDKEEDKFSLECFSVFFEEVPQTVVEVCDALVEKFNKLNEELAVLKEFKAEIEAQNLQADVDEVCAEFDLAEEEISEAKEKAYKGEISLEAFKKELFALVGMKAHAKKEKFSQKEKVAKPKIAIIETKADNKEPYGGLFAKYGK